MKRNFLANQKRRNLFIFTFETFSYHLLCLGLLLGLTTSCETEKISWSQDTTSEKTFRVTRGDFQERVLLTGRLDSATADEVGAPQTSMWTLSIRWMEEDGSQVKKGQKVLEFDNSQLVAELERKKLAVLQAKEALEGQKATNAITIADRKFELERQKNILEKAQLQAGIPSELLPSRTYEEYQLALERARVNHQQAKDALSAEQKSVTLEVKLKTLDLETAEREIQEIEDSIASLSLQAPRDDIFLAGDNRRENRKLQTGDSVWPGMTVVKFPNLSVMVVKALLSDVDEGRILPGMRVTCFLDAYPGEPIQGTVEQIDPIAQEAGNNSLRRFFGVTIALEKTDQERMRPGMSVKGEVHTYQKEDVLLIPRVAVDFRTKPPQVLLENGDIVVPTLGPCNAQDCVVLENLNEGTVVRIGDFW